MTEVLAEYENAIDAVDASVWAARACGRPLNGKWEAWIEFVPLTAGQSPVRTPRETTQTNREAAVEWATGITPTYLEGALERARERPIIVVTETAPPLFDTPAPTIGTASLGGPRPAAILDPYAVFAQGGDLLVDQLAALDTQHLRDIVSAYDIAPLETAVVGSRGELTAHIVAAVRERSAPSSRTAQRSRVGASQGRRSSHSSPPRNRRPRRAAESRR
jgi:hypothetical protein